MGKQKYSSESTVSSVNGSPVHKGREHYSFEKRRNRLNARAKAADIRNGAYEALSVKERIALVQTRMAITVGASKREMARLNALLATQKAAAVKPAPLTEAQKGAKAVKRAKDAATAAAMVKQSIHG